MPNLKATIYTKHGDYWEWSLAFPKDTTDRACGIAVDEKSARRIAKAVKAILDAEPQVTFED